MSLEGGRFPGTPSGNRKKKMGTPKRLKRHGMSESVGCGWVLGGSVGFWVEFHDLSLENV